MSGGGDEDKKPNAADQHINLKVKGQDGNEVFFRIKRNTQLKKLMNAYCDRQSVELNSIAFLFDGRRLRGEQTPDELEMEEGDEIDAMLHQTGGGGGDMPNTGDQGAHIHLKVKGQGGNEVFFRIKRSTQLKKLMNAYCDRQSVKLYSIVFLYEGRRLLGEQTPHELEMEEGDEIDAMLRQTGVSGAGGDEAKTGDQGAHILLKVKGQGGNEVFFRMRRSTRLKKLMNAYCDRQSVELNSIVFLFYGRRLQGEQTPDELEMEECDEIYAMPHLTGGIYEDLQMKLSVISV
ncbi:hypothetical protein CTI12_AA088830 [Artemisia annua]|uniref:Ubiquitin-like domain-containing protein n=1 Tax=Artemisia annua TaxID=35608 RepID=A0A2U1Q173_ARTAN|nr:hypothetical protein CTI12_AA088830 [Artemisia annua]